MAVPLRLQAAPQQLLPTTDLQLLLPAMVMPMVLPQKLTTRRPVWPQQQLQRQRRGEPAHTPPLAGQAAALQQIMILQRSREPDWAMLLV